MPTETSFTLRNLTTSKVHVSGDISIPAGGSYTLDPTEVALDPELGTSIHTLVEAGVLSSSHTISGADDTSMAAQMAAGMDAIPARVTAAEAATAALVTSSTAMIQEHAQGAARMTDVRVATTAALPTCTYENGTLGVGATLTGDVFGALAAQDAVTLIATNRILVQDQVLPAENGIYALTTVGAADAYFVLTRVADCNQAAEMVTGIFVYATAGTTNGGKAFYLSTTGTVVMGTTELVFAPFDASKQHANLAGGGFHADAIVSGASGFMTGADKNYLDGVVPLNQGTARIADVRLATAAALPECVYDNGASGDGATLTGAAVGVLADQDSVTPVATNRILVKDQVDATENGIFAVTTLGDAGTEFVLTRVADYNVAAEVLTGTCVRVTEGTTNAGTGWQLNTVGVVVMGTSDLTFGAYNALTQGGDIQDADFVGTYVAMLARTGAGAYTGIKMNLAGTVAPDADNDTDEDYVVGSIWLDITADQAYICVDNTADTAVWLNISETNPILDGDFAGDYVGKLYRSAAGVYHAIKEGSGAVDPTTAEDSTDDYEVGSIYLNTATLHYFICLDASEDAAEWAQLTPHLRAGIAGDHQLTAASMATAEAEHANQAMVESEPLNVGTRISGKILFYNDAVDAGGDTWTYRVYFGSDKDDTKIFDSGALAIVVDKVLTVEYEIIIRVLGGAGVGKFDCTVKAYDESTDADFFTFTSAGDIITTAASAVIASGQCSTTDVNNVTLRQLDHTIRQAY